MATATTGSSDFTVPYTGYITLRHENTKNSYSCCGKELSFKVVTDLLVRTHFQTISPSPIRGHRFTSNVLRDFHTVNHFKNDYLNCKHRRHFLAKAHELAVAPNAEAAEQRKNELNTLTLKDCASSKERTVQIVRSPHEETGMVLFDNQTVPRQLSFDECLRFSHFDSSFYALQVTYFINADNPCLGSSVSLPFITFFDGIPFLPSLIKNQLDNTDCSDLLKDQRHNSELKVPSSIPPPYNPYYRSEAQLEESVGSNSDDTLTVEPTAPTLACGPTPEHNSDITPSLTPTPDRPISRTPPPAYTPGNYFNVHPDQAESASNKIEHEDKGENSTSDSNEWLLV